MAVQLRWLFEQQSFTAEKLIFCSNMSHPIQIYLVPATAENWKDAVPRFAHRRAPDVLDYHCEMSAIIRTRNVVSLMCPRFDLPESQHKTQRLFLVFDGGHDHMTQDRNKLFQRLNVPLPGDVLLAAGVRRTNGLDDSDLFEFTSLPGHNWILENITRLERAVLHGWNDWNQRLSRKERLYELIVESRTLCNMIFAETDIPPVDFSGAFKICSTCQKRGKSLKYCGKCESSYYCSVKCQKQDWQRHKTECQLFTQVASLVNATSRLGMGDPVPDHFSKTNISAFLKSVDSLSDTSSSKLARNVLEKAVTSLHSSSSER